MPFFASDALAADKAPATTASTVATTEPAVPTAENMMIDNMLLLAALFFIFYYILLRPQQKRIKAHQELVKTLEKGQKIITSGGLIGVIHKFEGENVVVIEVAQGVKVRVARSFISEVSNDKTSGAIANDN